jgi:AraC family transcriptional regulator of adaptative response/methylated-DNA-[protein]-cysteine methyltransferase
MNDYERVARAIRFLDAHRAEQPDLAAVAGSAGLSPFHFHRLFSRWAGLTPKDFLQVLTLEHVKNSLRRGKSVLSAALDAGLSGPARAHDLCLTLEAATPGEMNSGGASWTLQAGFTSTPFGKCLIALGPRGICHLSFLGADGEAAAWNGMRAEWPNALFRRDDAEAESCALRIFVVPGGGPSARMRGFVRGTAFQVRVWRALLCVPPGATVTYGSIAASVGRPGASRAVGSAVARNPLAYLIPCHRVIRETGALGDYRWGRERKQALLVWETKRLSAAPPGANCDSPALA